MSKDQQIVSKSMETSSENNNNSPPNSLQRTANVPTLTAATEKPLHYTLVIYSCSETAIRWKLFSLKLKYYTIEGFVKRERIFFNVV